MNKIERLHAALKSQPVDRVPLSLWHTAAHLSSASHLL